MSMAVGEKSQDLTYFKLQREAEGGEHEREVQQDGGE